MTEILERPAARETYDAMAPYYDAFTAHHDYELWTAVIRRLAGQHGLVGTRLLDVGCGTGKSFLPFAADGWQVTGCDVSARMLELAAAKAPAGVRLHRADARELPRYGAFDLVLLLDDVVNYLTEQEDVVRAMTAAGANLATGRSHRLRRQPAAHVSHVLRGGGDRGGRRQVPRLARPHACGR